MNIYLPVIRNESALPPLLKIEELDLFSLVCTDPEQRRSAITLDDCLCKTARWRCEDMAARRYFGHIDPDGVTPNQRCRERGCALPDWYSPGNNIESIAAGYATVESAWDAWKASPTHRLHVLSEHEFFQGQVRCGVGYYCDEQAPYHHYWTVWFAHEVDAANAADVSEVVEVSGGIIE